MASKFEKGLQLDRHWQTGADVSTPLTRVHWKVLVPKGADVCRQVPMGTDVWQRVPMGVCTEGRRGWPPIRRQQRQQMDGTQGPRGRVEMAIVAIDMVDRLMQAPSLPTILIVPMVLTASPLSPWDSQSFGEGGVGQNGLQRC